VLDMKLFDMVIENEPINCVKVVVTLNAPPDKIFSFIQSSDVKILQQFDKDLFDVKVIERFESDNNQLEICHVYYSAPFPVAWRDCVILRGVQKNSDGSVLSLNASINDARAEEPPSYVRAMVRIAGWIIKPTSDGKQSNCIRVAQIDPRGWIPALIVNLFKRKVAEGIISLDEVLSKKMNYHESYKKKKCFFFFLKKKKKFFFLCMVDTANARINKDFKSFIGQLSNPIPIFTFNST